MIFFYLRNLLVILQQLRRPIPNRIDIRCISQKERLHLPKILHRFIKDTAQLETNFELKKSNLYYTRGIGLNRLILNSKKKVAHLSWSGIEPSICRINSYVVNSQIGFAVVRIHQVDVGD